MAFGDITSLLSGSFRREAAEGAADTARDNADPKGHSATKAEATGLDATLLVYASWIRIDGDFSQVTAVRFGGRARGT